uniref:Dentin sialophosphoprotein-like n=1 Tax=Hirondellea gigas TaxID=1518452 RepID=A0A2P2I4Q8_9CRUS
MSELGKANETNMGLPRSGGGSNRSNASSKITNSISSIITRSNSSRLCHSSNNATSSISKTSGRGQKRSWDDPAAAAGASRGTTGVATDRDEEPPSKMVCTSPPHALCAEDVLQQPDQPPATSCSNFVESSTTSSLQQEEHNFDSTTDSSTSNTSESSASSTATTITNSIMARSTDELLPIEATCGPDDYCDIDADNEDRDFLDDTDKDSGFVDSNSIDNSSDDDMVSSADANCDLSDVKCSYASDIATSSIASSCENSVTVTSTMDKLSLASSPPAAEDNFKLSTSDAQSSDSISYPLSSHHSSMSPVPSSTTLPSCSSAFSTYTAPSSNNSFTSDMDVAYVPTTMFQSTLSPPAYTTCSEDGSCVEPSDIDFCQSQSSIFNSTINNLNSSVTISEVLSTSIALSVDILSNPSHSPPCINQSYSSSVEVPAHSSSVLSSSSQALPSISTVTRSLDFTPCSESSNMSTASGNSDTIVTTAYPGTLSTPAYEPHLYPSSYSPELSQRQGNSVGNLVNGTWSCNFYDANQPSMTNKYMEIQTSKIGAAPTSQAIRCDANGKSYIDLGSSSPYTQTYANECGNYTTSPSNNYSNNMYNNQPYTNSNYNQQQQQQSSQSNQFYRPGYSQYNYPNGEAYPPNYETDAGCSYRYNHPNYPCSRTTKPSSRPHCYQQQRLSVLNMSMCKLNRFSRCADPSLLKSVLICNTLRMLEKEYENEGTSMNAVLQQQHMMQAASLPPHCPAIPLTPPPPGMGSSEGPLPSMHPPIVNSPLLGPCPPPPIIPSYNNSNNSNNSLQYRNAQYPDGLYEDIRLYHSALDLEPLSPNSDSNSLHILRGHHPSSPLPLLSQTLSPLPHGSTSSSLTPVFNNTSSNNNGTSTNPVCSSNSSNNTSSRSGNTCNSSCSGERPEGGINWCSVLSLPSQSDLDSLNNNEYCEWGGESSMELEYSSGSSSGSSSSSSNSSNNSSNSNNISNTRPVSTSTEDSNGSPQWKLPSLSAEDVLKSFPEPSRRIEPSEDLDNIMNVLVES